MTTPSAAPPPHPKPSPSSSRSDVDMDAESHNSATTTTSTSKGAAAAPKSVLTVSLPESLLSLTPSNRHTYTSFSSRSARHAVAASTTGGGRRPGSGAADGGGGGGGGGAAAKTGSVAEGLMVVPGDVIAPGGGSLYMRGHGTFLGGDNNDDIMASVSGMVERVDKLICVRSLRCRYLGEIGDVVVGRVTQVGQGKWRVDVNSRVDAVLLLSSIDLPGGVLRKRTYSDELNMRTFYAENDLICAEVHSLSGNGAMNLQTRSHRYGKLLNGIFMAIPPTLIKRSKSHMHTFDFGVSVIFGNNGYIWIYVTADPLGAVHGDPTQAAQEEQPTAHSETTPTSAENPPPATTPTTNPQPYRPTPAEQIEMRTRLARVRNSVSTLASVHCWVHPDAVSAVYQESLLQKLTPKEMLNPALWASLTEPARTSAVDLYAVSSS